MAMDITDGFIIKNKPHILAFAITGIIASAIIAGSFVVLILYCEINSPAVWAVMIMPAFTLSVSLLGLYCYKKEKFIFKDGVFTYIKVFKKTQSAPAESISEVIFRKNMLLVKVEFINKKGEPVISFLDDGTAFENVTFLDTLKKLEIPFKNT